MCKFCREWHGEDTICGSEMPIFPCGNRNSKLTEAQLLKNTADDDTGVVIYEQGKPSGYFKIRYCPMCGRKLVEDD